MKKWIVATLMTASMFAMSTGSSPATAAGHADDADEIGACVYDCSSNGVRYRTRAACHTACSGFCEPLC